MPDTLAPERSTTEDATTAVPVTRWTHHRGHSHHPYFTNPGWFDAGRRLLIASDRGEHRWITGLDLETGEMTPLLPAEDDIEALEVCVNPTRDEGYVLHRGVLEALDLHTGRRRPIWRMPDRFVHSMLNATADGRHVCVGIYEDLSDRFPIDLTHQYVGFEQTFEAKPLSRVVRVEVDGPADQPGDVRWEEHHWIGHVNTSPTDPNLLSFCHEGPWHRVGQRIWVLDLDAGRAWPVRQQDPDDAVGHEYWFADGKRIGYHGHNPDGKLYGWVNADDAGRVEARFPTDSHHFHSLDDTLIVGDGPASHYKGPGRRHGGMCPYVLMWRWNGSAFEGPKVLCEHYSSRYQQIAHVHPRFSPDGKTILFASDRSGYVSVYTAPVRAWDDMPDLASL